MLCAMVDWQRQAPHLELVSSNGCLRPSILFVCRCVLGTVQATSRTAVGIKHILSREREGHRTFPVSP